MEKKLKRLTEVGGRLIFLIGFCNLLIILIYLSYLLITEGNKLASENIGVWSAVSVILIFLGACIRFSYELPKLIIKLTDWITK